MLGSGFTDRKEDPSMKSRDRDDRERELSLFGAIMISNSTPPQAMHVQVLAFGQDPMSTLAKNIVLEPMSFPEVEKLASQDVIIEIRSAALSWVDLLMSCGLYQHRARLPYTPGLEYSGIIRWMGKDVDRRDLNIGDKVFVGCFHTGPRSSGNYQQYGGFASFAVAPSSLVQKIPEHLNFDQACNFAGNYETAYHCLVACGKLQAGETVLIHGASGATGLAAVHIAKLLGATVIATGRNPKKLKVVKEQGADHVLVIGKNEDGSLIPFRKQVKEWTEGRGADVVYDGVGGDISVESLRAMRFGGRFLVVGWASTPFVRNSKPNQLPTNLILMKGLQILGCPAVISVQKNPEIRIKRLEELMGWLHEGKLNPYVAAVYPLAEVHQAMRDKWEGKIIGGCALRPV